MYPFWPDLRTSLRKKPSILNKEKDSSNAWNAAGRAIEQHNTKLRYGVERCLSQIKAAEVSPIFLQFNIIGRRQAKASPTIVICSDNREAMEKPEEATGDRGSLHRRPDSRQDPCSLPLAVGCVSNSLPNEECQSRGSHASGTNGSDPKTSNPVASGISGPRLGRRLEVKTASETGSPVQNATGGLILRIGKELYQITSLHATEDLGDSNWVPKSASETDECELPSGAIGCSLKWKDQDADPASPILMDPTLMSHKSTPPYTLIKLSELEIGQASNEILGRQGDGTQRKVILNVAKVGNEAVSIVVVTSRGPIAGVVLPERTLLKLRGSSLSQAVHTVKLSELIEQGDSGAAVIDPATGTCYGHIILGAERDFVAYMVPAPDTLADILLSFGKLPSLQLRRPSVAERSGDVKRWKCVIPRAGIESQPLSPLDKCTSCSTGKLYSTRSRAAAHLRRNHLCSEPANQRKNTKQTDSKKGDRLPGPQLKKCISETTVTPLYAKVMEAESDSESDYENDADVTDDESEKVLPLAISEMAISDRQASAEEENKELRRHNKQLGDGLKLLEGDIDVLMEDREELKQKVDYLEKILLEQELEAPRGVGQPGSLLRVGREWIQASDEKYEFNDRLDTIYSCGSSNTSMNSLLQWTESVSSESSRPTSYEKESCASPKMTIHPDLDVGHFIRRSSTRRKVPQRRVGRKARFTPMLAHLGMRHRNGAADRHLRALARSWKKSGTVLANRVENKEGLFQQGYTPWCGIWSRGERHYTLKWVHKRGLPAAGS